MDISLRFPFEGSYPLTLAFGVKPMDISINNKFKKWGIIGHHGLDFGLPEKTPVLAAADGQVILSENQGDFGTSVIIKHPWGESIYAHLLKTKVVKDQYVTKGEIIALSGKTGAVSGPHLHFGIKPIDPDLQNGYLGYIDPIPYLIPAFSQKTAVIPE